MTLSPAITKTLRALSKLPMDDKLIVFGSVAKGAEQPNDLDVVLDATAVEAFDLAQQRGFEETHETMLRLARRHYGCVDPFVMIKGALRVRSDDAHAWVRAKNAPALRKAIETDGVPLLDLIRRVAIADEEPQGRPARLKP